MAKEKERIIELQKSVKIMKAALERIKFGHGEASAIAEQALDDVWKLEPKQSLQGLCESSTWPVGMKRT